MTQSIVNQNRNERCNNKYENNQRFTEKSNQSIHQSINPSINPWCAVQKSVNQPINRTNKETSWLIFIFTYKNEQQKQLTTYKRFLWGLNFAFLSEWEELWKEQWVNGRMRKNRSSQQRRPSAGSITLQVEFQVWPADPTGVSSRSSGSRSWTVSLTYKRQK